MKICVTGGAGFIGSHLVDKLIDQGHDVIVIDNFSTGLRENVNPKATILVADLSVSCSATNFIFNKCISSCNQVYHLAATVGYKKVLEDPLKCFNNNVDSLKAVIGACEGKDIKLLYTSSSEVYGLSTEGYLAEDDLYCVFTNPRNGKDCYSISKWVGELMLYRNPKVKSVMVRLFNTSGARQRPDFGMVLPSFVKAAIDNKPATVAGNGQQRRCFCHVSDVVDALIGLMNADTDNADLFNVGNRDNDIGIQQLCILTGCKSISFVPHDDLYGHNNFVDVGARVPSLTKITDKIGWKPKMGIQEIIESNKVWQQSR